MEERGKRLGQGDRGSLLTVYSFTHEISVDAASALPRMSRGVCWGGDALAVPLSWSVAVDPKTLWFVCSLPGGKTRVPNDSPGAFIEGLWEGDVAEFFIKNEDGAYQEINCVVVYDALKLSRKTGAVAKANNP